MDADASMAGRGPLALVTSSVDSCVERFSSVLKLPSNVSRCAKGVARRVVLDQGGHSSTVPTLCAASLYIIAGLTEMTTRSKPEVAEAGGMSAASLAKTVRALVVMEGLVPEQYMEDLIEQGCRIQVVQ